MNPSNLQTEFGYDSPYWTNKETYAVDDGLEGLTEKQTKLASYWSTPFKKMCLGMKVNGETKWISFDYNASSLYSVIKNETFESTNAGREKWRFLIDGSSLQTRCNREGFNVMVSNNYNYNSGYIKARIGIVANNNDHCYDCDSCIGFGISFRGCDGNPRHSTCGNIMAHCRFGNNKEIATFGFVLVQ